MDDSRKTGAIGLKKPVLSGSIEGRAMALYGGIPGNSGILSGGLSYSGINDRNYDHLFNKPKINGVELIGELMPEEIGAQPSGDYVRTDEIKILSNWEIEEDFKF